VVAKEAGEKLSRSRAARRASFGFLARFVALLVVLYAAVAWHPINDRVIVPFTAGIASVSGAVLRALGEPAVVTDTLISGGGFGVHIENGCNGIETAILFVSAVLAFPASWAARGIGIAAGFLAIQAINLVRVVSLFWVGRHHPAVFEASHGLVWQSIVVLFGVLLFFVWAARVPRLSRAAES
jgi:exosortase H (IPTLxxWG-CTERM-specific)